jgi:serine phosphatase RsbU (regulator of sigma subunit)
VLFSGSVCPGAADAGPPAPIRVLLVEDDPGDARLTSELLRDSGFSFKIEPVRGLAEALAHLGRGVECVLLDLGLPDAGGLEALDEILAAAPRTAVIVLTGRADRDVALVAMSRGAQDYLQKGQIDRDLLSRSVRYAVERKRSEEAARQLLARELMAAESARLERGLLARPMLAQSGLRSASRYRSAGGSLLLGGDFYDAIELADGSVRLVIGDVSGHGPDEAAIGVALRIAWRGFVLGRVEQEAVLPNLQALLDAERHNDDLFATVCDATIAPDRRSIALRLAGHPGPILMGEDPHQLTASPGLPLGIFETSQWHSEVFPLPPQWTLIFYTDGIVEGRTRDDPSKRLGPSGLISQLRSGGWPSDNLGELADRLLAVAEEQNGGAPPDDIALFLVAGAG